MAREFDTSKPLSSEDIAYLRSRHSKLYVARMVELHGDGDSPEKAEQPSGEPSTQEDHSEDGDDLIGNPEEGTFDPSKHTNDEVNAYLASASAEEKQRVLDAEADGRGRSGILNES